MCSTISKYYIAPCHKERIQFYEFHNLQTFKKTVENHTIVKDLTKINTLQQSEQYYNQKPNNSQQLIKVKPYNNQPLQLLKKKNLKSHKPYKQKLHQ